MDLNGHHRCPDCGARVWVPITLVRIPERPGWARAVLREEEFMEAFQRHFMLNPDRHPSYVTTTVE